MKGTKYTTAEGNVKSFYEVVPYSVKILEGKIQPQCGL